MSKHMQEAGGLSSVSNVNKIKVTGELENVADITVSTVLKMRIMQNKC